MGITAFSNRWCLQHLFPGNFWSKRDISRRGDEAWFQYKATLFPNGNYWEVGPKKILKDTEAGTHTDKNSEVE